MSTPPIKVAKAPVVKTNAIKDTKMGARKPRASAKINAKRAPSGNLDKVAAAKPAKIDDTAQMMTEHIDMEKQLTSSVQKQQDDRITLAHSLSIADAVTLQAQLADCSVNKIPVRIDAGAVARVDTAILQVLLASAITGRFSGRPLTWTEVSEDFLMSAQRLGLSAELGLPKRG